MQLKTGLTAGNWEDQGHDKDGCDEDDPGHSDPPDHQAQAAQVKWPRLKLLVVKEADADGDGVCMLCCMSAYSLRQVLQIALNIPQKLCHLESKDIPGLHR